MSQSNSLALSRKFFLTQFGLDHDSVANDVRGWPSTIKLAVGDIDPRSRGAVAVTSQMTRDPETGTINIVLDRWRMRPNGEQVRHNLFDFRFVNNAANDQIIPQSLWVMGRPLYDPQRDGDPLAVAAGVMRNVNTGRSAISHLHQALRKNQLPDVAKIFKQTGLPQALGENLYLVGQSPEGGFDFDVFEAYAKPVNDDFVLPTDVAEALIGEDANTIDAHQRLGKERMATAVLPQNRNEFVAQYNANDNASGAINSTIRIDPISVANDTNAYEIPEFAVTGLSPASEDNQRTLSEFKFLGVDLLNADHDLRMKAIGVVNRAKHALRQREYPHILDYAAEFDLLDYIDFINTADLADPPPPEGRLIVESKGGNNTGDEIAEGYSHQPNGNCKAIEVQWPDSKGQIRHVGAIHDIGLFLPPLDVANEGAIADIVKELTYSKSIFLSHRHLDHIDGAIPYIAKGYLKGKVVYAAPECLRSLREKLNTFDILEEYHPVYVPLQGRGWVHIKDDDDITRLSVGYSVDGTPHTARCTPYIYVARNGSQVIDSYLNPGDMRFGRHNAENYKGFRPDADYLDKYFFQNWQKLLREDDPNIEPAVLDFPTMRMDIDGTSIRKPDWAPTDWECETNQLELFTLLNEILPEKLVGIGQISTNEMGLETRLRLATQLGRDVTASGANMERTVRTANVMGVNKLRVEAKSEGNNQLYLDYFFEQINTKRLSELQRQYDQTPENKRKERKRLEKEIEMETRVLEYFSELRDIKQSNKRFARRDELEAEFMDAYGEHRHLGSVYTTIAAKCARRMMREPGRWLTLETGTQGTNVEIDASMSKRSFGTSRFDMPASQKPTARPVSPKKSILCLSQVAIPGNDKKQREMLNRLVMRGYIVVLAINDGYEIHGLSQTHGRTLFDALRARGRAIEEKNDGSLVISGRPIHAPGHGFLEDIKAWLKLVNPMFPMLQHTGDPLAEPAFIEATKTTLNRLGYYFGNFHRVTTAKSESPIGRSVKALSRSRASIIRFVTDRKTRNYHGGHIEAERITNFNNADGHREDGLIASVVPGGAHRQHFATVNGEVFRRRAAARKAKSPQPIAYNRAPPAFERRYRGPRRPGEDRRKLAMKSGERLRVTG